MRFMRRFEHGTPADLLIAAETASETRRSKYVAVSRLSDDYMDTSALLKSFEGELEGEEDMVGLFVSHFGSQFGWDQGVAASAEEAGAFPGSSPSARGGMLPQQQAAAEAEGDHKPRGALPTTYEPPRDTSSPETSAATLDGGALLTRARGGARPEPKAFRSAADHATRLHQYEKSHGDRSEFSLACVLDGDCGVDFERQIPEDGFGGAPDNNAVLHGQEAWQRRHPTNAEAAAGEHWRRWTTHTDGGVPTSESQDTLRSSFTGRRQ